MNKAPLSALRIAAIYFIIAGLWIALSDRALSVMLGGAAGVGWAQTLKGWLFVLVTSVLLYLLIRQEIERRQTLDVQRKNLDRRLDTLVSNLPGMVYQCENKPDWPMSYVSPGALELTGYSPEELIGESIEFGNLVHHEDADTVWKSVQEAVDEKRPFQLVYRICTKNGPIRWVWEQGQGVFLADGTLSHLEGFIMDISDKKLLEDQLQQAQRLEALGKLAGGVAHDFNNLLTIIQGRLELMQRKLGQSPEVARDMKAILQACQRATTFTRQLLSVGRRRMVEAHMLNLNRAVEEIVDLVRRTVGEDVDLGIQYAPEPVYTIADSGQVEQILLNLVINGRDAMPEGGKLTVETRIVDIDEDKARQRIDLPPGRYALLSVSDTGIGMDEQTRARIFEPFFTTKQQKGTGLGLATVYGIVKQLGGSIWVYSEPGHGTTFKVYLPLTEAQEKREEVKAPKPAVGGSPERILIVEDDQEVRALAEQILRDNGYTVLVAENGQRALEIVRSQRQPLGLVISDVVMPGMSGPTMASQLRSDHPELRVLFVSGYTDQHLSGTGMLEPGTSFLEKPFTPDELLSRVRELVPQARA